MLLLFARQKSSFSETESPAWVNEWLSRRTKKQEKQIEKKDSPVDEAAQQKRALARLQKVKDGIQELKTWLKDFFTQMTCLNYYNRIFVAALDLRKARKS